jgi:hypothetical protein
MCFCEKCHDTHQLCLLSPNLLSARSTPPVFEDAAKAIGDGYGLFAELMERAQLL